MATGGCQKSQPETTKLLPQSGCHGQPLLLSPARVAAMQYIGHFHYRLIYCYSRFIVWALKCQNIVKMSVAIEA